MALMMQQRFSYIGLVCMKGARLTAQFLLKNHLIFIWLLTRDAKMYLKYCNESFYRRPGISLQYVGAVSDHQLVRELEEYKTTIRWSHPPHLTSTTSNWTKVREEEGKKNSSGCNNWNNLLCIYSFWTNWTHYFYPKISVTISIGKPVVDLSP